MATGVLVFLRPGDVLDQPLCVLGRDIRAGPYKQYRRVRPSISTDSSAIIGPSNLSAAGHPAAGISNCRCTPGAVEA
jgi:hypothetical protein